MFPSLARALLRLPEERLDFTQITQSNAHSELEKDFLSVLLTDFPGEL